MQAGVPQAGRIFAANALLLACIRGQFGFFYSEAREPFFGNRLEEFHPQARSTPQHVRWYVTLIEVLVHGLRPLNVEAGAFLPGDLLAVHNAVALTLEYEKDGFHVRVLPAGTMRRVR
jgi:hypothetical protein